MNADLLFAGVAVADFQRAVAWISLIHLA